MLVLVISPAPVKVSLPEMETARKCHLRPRRLHRRSPAGYRPSSGQHSLAVVDRWRASCSPGRAPLIGADVLLRGRWSSPELVIPEKCHLRPHRLRRRSPAGYRLSSGQHSLVVVHRWRTLCPPGSTLLIGADAHPRQLPTQKSSSPSAQMPWESCLSI